MIDEYALFAHVIEAGSLSAAARRLKLSPAMVSKRLARLEARLGARLIHRTTRRLSTTEVGQQFYEDVVRILAAAQAAENGVAGQARRPAGRLRVSAPTSFGRLHIAPHLNGFIDAYPDVRVELDLQDSFTDLLGDRIDVAVRISAPGDKSLAWRRLAANRRVLCAAPAYLVRHGAPADLRELARRPLLAADGQLPWRLEGPNGPTVLAGESRLRTNSSEVVRELALSGLGIALRSTWDVANELRSGALIRILPDYQGAPDVGIYAAHLGSSLAMPNVQAFIAYFADMFAAPVWEPIDAAR
jgi:DNA-binding transcriptional LysR family regulator